MAAIKTGSTPLANYEISLYLLEAGVRTPTNRTVTAGSAASIGATSMSLSISSADTIEAGTSLSFAAASSPTNRQQALITQTAAMTTSPASYSVAALTRAIASSSTATFAAGLIPLLGIQSFETASAETMVDSTDTRSGTGTESTNVRYKRTIAVQCIEVPNDEAMNIIKQICENPAFINREVYVVATSPDGEKREGAAKPSALSFPGNQNEIKKVNFTLEFQGSSFIWTPPYYFA